MRVPISQVSRQTGSSGGFSAHDVTPRGDATGQQLQRFGRSLQEAGSAVSEIELSIDITRAKEADNLAADVERRLMHDPKEGYGNAVGRDAIDRREQLDRTYDTEIGKIRSTLRTHRQVAMFEKAQAQRAQRFKGTADVHFAQQQRNWQAGTYAAAVETGIADAVQGFGTTAYDVKKQLVHRDVDELANSRGYGQQDPQRVLLHRDADTKLHGMVLSQLVDSGQATAARSYLEKNAGEIDQEALGKMRSLVERAGVDDMAFRLSQAIAETGKPFEEQVALVNQRVGKEMPIEVLGNKVGSIPAITVEVRDATIARLKDAENMRVRAAAVAEDKLAVEAETWLLENPQLGVQAMPPKLFVAVRDAGLLPRIGTFAENHRYLDDPQALGQLEGMSTEALRELSPAQFRNQFRHRLGERNWTHAQALYAQAWKVEKEEQTFLLDQRDVLRAAAAQHYKIPRSGQLNDRQAATFDTFLRHVQPRLEAFERGVLKGQRKANPAEMQKLVDDLLIDTVTVPGGLFDSEQSVLDITEEQFEESYIESGPLAGPYGFRRRANKVYPGRLDEGVRARIIRDLMDAGRPVTQRTIAETYLQDYSPNRPTAGRK